MSFLRIHRPKFLDPKSDIVFKKIFGQYPDLMKSFLNTVLPLPKDALIESLDYLSPDQTPTIPGLKNPLVTVGCKDQQGRHFIVEIQLQGTRGWAHHLLYSASKSYVQQENIRDKDLKFRPLYGLALVNDVFDPTTQEWFHRCHLFNEETQEIHNTLKLLFIELPKFKADNKLHCPMGIKWLRFLKEIDGQNSEIPEGIAGDLGIDQAIALIQASSYSLDELDAYDQHRDTISIEKAWIVESYAAGLKKGLQQGRDEGRREAIIGVAQNLKDFEMSEGDIAKMTGLGL